MFRNTWHRWLKRPALLSEQRPRKRSCPLRSYRLNLEGLENRTLLSTFTVDRLTDTGEGSDLAGDLRYCITHATSGQDTIDFGVTGTLSLTQALPDLTRSVRIDGPGPDLVTVRRDTGGDYRIFTVDNGATVEISGLTIANGTTSTDGGGILNNGTLTVTHSTITGCSAGAAYSISGAGGGISNGRSGVLTIRECTLSDNHVLTRLPFGQGGGINNEGMLAVDRTTVSRNQASNGAGISNSGGTLTISNSTISSNRAGDGGGISNFAPLLTVSTTTFSDNTASDGNGGAISSGGGTVMIRCSTFSGNAALENGSALIASGLGSLNVSNSTIAGNRDGYGTIYLLMPTTISNSTISGNRSEGGTIVDEVGTLTLYNTILFGGGTRPNLLLYPGIFVSRGHNLSSDNGSGLLTGPGDQINTDPMLGTLQDNGGPTQTMALLPGSPAVDAGDNTDVPDFDQRSFTRIVGGIIDIGAFEAQIGAATQLAVSAPSHVSAGSPFDVTVTAWDAYHHTASGYAGTVTFASSDTDPAVVLPADYTFTAADQGVHTFVGGFTLTTVGDQSLTATDTADGTITGRITVTVDPGPTAPPGSGAIRPAIPTVLSVEEQAFVVARFRRERPAADLFSAAVC
jgi:predicted outer membrane repeat protein